MAWIACQSARLGLSVRRVGTFRDIHRAFELSAEAARDPCAAHRRADDPGGPSVPAPIWRAVLLCAIWEAGWAHDVSGSDWQILARAMQPITTMMPVWQCGHSRNECPVNTS